MKHNLELLRQEIPSVFAEAPAPTVSSRYKFISTMDYIRAMEENGWEVHGVYGARRSEHSKHFVRFVRPDLSFSHPELGGIRPEALFRNSHDGQSSAKFVIQIFRKVCLNGLVIGVDILGYQFPHTASALDVSEVVTKAFLDSIQQMFNTAELMSRHATTSEERMSLALLARDLRFPDNPSIIPETLLLPTVGMDQGRYDLWTIYNTIQQHVTQGGRRYGGKRRAKGLTNMEKIVKINSALWAHAMKILGL